MVNYKNECSVLFFFVNEQEKLVKFNYERPQYVDDITLNLEARNNAEDILKKKLHGAKELIAIGIARSQKQHDEILKEIRGN